MPMPMPIRRCAFATALCLSAAAAPAAVVTLTFEGAGNLARLEGYHNGGTDSQGHAGPNLGVAFGPTALSIIDEDVPSATDSPNTGNFGNEPSPDTVLFFLEAQAVLNVADGFRDGFSFFYSSTTFAGVVSVFDQVDAGGALIGTIALSPLGEGQGDPTGSYNRWLAAGLSFSGVARSIAFGGTGDRIALDNVTFGSATPTPPAAPSQDVAEPSTLALLGLGLVSAAALARRRV